MHLSPRGVKVPPPPDFIRRLEECARCSASMPSLVPRRKRQATDATLFCNNPRYAVGSKWCEPISLMIWFACGIHVDIILSIRAGEEFAGMAASNSIAARWRYDAAWPRPMIHVLLLSAGLAPTLAACATQPFGQTCEMECPVQMGGKVTNPNIRKMCVSACVNREQHSAPRNHMSGAP